MGCSQSKAASLSSIAWFQIFLEVKQFCNRKCPASSLLVANEQTYSARCYAVLLLKLLYVYLTVQYFPLQVFVVAYPRGRILFTCEQKHFLLFKVQYLLHARINPLSGKVYRTMLPTELYFLNSKGFR